MGHHETGSSYNHREALVVQKRIASFLLVFSVTAIAFVLLTASIQTRDAKCQTRAGIGLYSIYFRPDQTNKSIITDIHLELGKSGVKMEPFEAGGPKERQMETFDTTEGTLRQSGFTLLRETGPAKALNVHWQLRYVDPNLCTTRRKISMEALNNVDYEKVTYRVKAVSTGNKAAFLYIVDVMTKDMERATTYPQLQALFPGFHAHIGSPRMLTKASLRFSTEFTAELYYGNTLMGIELQMEKWQHIDNNMEYGRIMVSSRDPLAEENLRKVTDIVSRVVRREEVLCDKVTCGPMFDNMFLQ